MGELIGNRPNEADAKLTQYFATAANAYSNGFLPIPIKPASKEAMVRGWQFRTFIRRSFLFSEIERWPDAGMAILCGRCCAVDIDLEDPFRAEQFQEKVLAIVPGKPLIRFGRPPRRALVYRTDGSIRTRHEQGFDILGTGSYLMAFGIHPDTAQPYRWLHGSPATMRLDELPLITNEHVAAILNWGQAAQAPVPGAVSEWEAPASAPASEWEAPADGLILDGRDMVMRNIIWRLRGLGITDPEQLTNICWAEFSAKVDLTRPKRGGQAPWARADAAEKVAYLLKSGKVPSARRSPHNPRHDLADDPFRAFAAAINSIGAAGHLAPADVRVSNCMLELCLTERGCFLSVEEIARRLDLAIGSVKRCRGKLVALGLWSRTVRGGGRGNLAFLVPRPEQACAFAEKVTKIVIRSSRREVDDVSPSSLDSLKKEKEKNIKLFQSLIVSREEPDHG